VSSAKTSTWTSWSPSTPAASAACAPGSLDRLGLYANLAARFAEIVTRHDDRIGLVVYADRVPRQLRAGGAGPRRG